MTVNACAALVQAGDPDRFLAAMAAPAALRGGLFTLYALNLEVAKAPFVTQEPMIAEMRLQFWRDTVADAVAGKPVRAHEVAAPLAELLAARSLPEDMLDAMIAARRFDIYPGDPGQSGLDLDSYLRRTGGHLMALTGLALGMDVPRVAAAQDVGQAMGTALWLRAIPDLAGHARVAADDLDSAALQARAQAGLDLLAKHRGTRFGAATPAIRAGWLTRPILQQAVQDPRQVIDGALGVSEFQRRGGLLWRSVAGRW